MRRPDSARSRRAGPGPGARAAGAVLVGGLVGLLVAGLGSVVHQLVIGPAALPVGLVLALALTGAAAGTLRAAGAGWPVRGALALGWAAAVWTAAAPQPGGDFLVAANGRGYGWLGGGALLLLVVLAGPSGRGRSGRVSRRRRPARRPHDLRAW